MARRRRVKKPVEGSHSEISNEPRHGGTLNIPRACLDFKFAGAAQKDDINQLALAAMRKLGVEPAKKSTVKVDPKAEVGSFNLKNYKNFVAGVHSRGKAKLLTGEAVGLQELELASRH